MVAAALLTENVTQKRDCVCVSASASVSATVMLVGKRADTVLGMQLESLLNIYYELMRLMSFKFGFFFFLYFIK